MLAHVYVSSAEKERRLGENQESLCNYKHEKDFFFSYLRKNFQEKINSQNLKEKKISIFDSLRRKKKRVAHLLLFECQLDCN